MTFAELPELLPEAPMPGYTLLKVKPAGPWFYWEEDGVKYQLAFRGSRVRGWADVTLGKERCDA